MGGNGHNVSFDGRLYIVRDHVGWRATVLRPEGVSYLPSGLPDAQAMFSPKVALISGGGITENALAICEPDPSLAPFACNEAGAAGGSFDCYDVWILDSDAQNQNNNLMHRRHLKLWVSSPRTPSASIHKFEWGTREPLSTSLWGIEPTVTSDGKLMVYQGHPDNDSTIDILMYAVNDQACAASGWSTPKSISEMHTDPRVVGSYALGDRSLRAADGQIFQPGELFRGAYPWLMPEGDALIFTGANMPCVSQDNPPGCGPRRNALSVIGYPTNWGIAHIDGGVNPSTTHTVRLFFSSPGPSGTFNTFPVTEGQDVWPLFGSNTSNYVELIFDDGLDGHYAGYWHLNENVDHAGNLDKSRTPDVSGYFNTGTLAGGLDFADDNNGVLGKALVFDGVDDRVVVPDAVSLNPVNGITIEAALRPFGAADCDGNNNWRMLIAKGNIADGAYTVVFEEGGALQIRVNVDGEQRSLIGPPLAIDQWTHIAYEYDGPSGQAGLWYDGLEVASAMLPAGTIASSGADLTIGAPGARDVCPNGDGAFVGMIDEVAISRYARRLGEPIEPPGGEGGAGAGGATTSGGQSGGDGGAAATTSGGGAQNQGRGSRGTSDAGGCAVSAPGGGLSIRERRPPRDSSAAWLLLSLALLARRRRS